MLGLQQPGAADPLRDPSVVGRARAVATSADNDDVVNGIERRLKCTCGCSLDIFTCRTTDFSCIYSPELHQEVVGLCTAGSSPDEVIAAFVAKHGESILLAPPTEGFNLLGYLLPSALVVSVGGALGFLLLRRHRMRLVAVNPARPVGMAEPGPTAEEQARLDRALAELDG